MSHETTAYLAQSRRLQHLVWVALLILCSVQLLSGRVDGEEDDVDPNAPSRARVKALKQRQPSGLGTIILRKASWQRLSPDPIRWPRAGEPLVLEPGHELLSNIEIGPGQCCVIRARLEQPRADRKVSWEPDAGDPTWGLRDRSGHQRLAFRIVGDQGYLDCRDLNSPRLAALPQPHRRHPAAAVAAVRRGRGDSPDGGHRAWTLCRRSAHGSCGRRRSDRR